MKLFSQLNLPLTKQYAPSASALKTVRENRGKPVQLTEGLAVMLISGSAFTGSVKKGRLELFQLQKSWKCQWEKGIGTQ